MPTDARHNLVPWDVVGAPASTGALLVVGKQCDRLGNDLILSRSAIGFGTAVLSS